jgi:hypothetical protein
LLRLIGVHERSLNYLFANGLRFQYAAGFFLGSPFEDDLEALCSPALKAGNGGLKSVKLAEIIGFDAAIVLRRRTKIAAVCAESIAIPLSAQI